MENPRRTWKRQPTSSSSKGRLRRSAVSRRCKRHTPPCCATWARNLLLLLEQLEWEARWTKKVREKSRECHNHKPQPFPDTKRKRKPTNLNKHKPNKRTKSTKISSRLGGHLPSTCQAPVAKQRQALSHVYIALPSTCQTPVAKQRQALSHLYTALAEQRQALSRISHLERWGSMGHSRCVGKRPCLPSENSPRGR